MGCGASSSGAYRDDKASPTDGEAVPSAYAEPESIPTISFPSKPSANHEDDPHSSGCESTPSAIAEPDCHEDSAGQANLPLSRKPPPYWTDGERTLPFEQRAAVFRTQHERYLLPSDDKTYCTFKRDNLLTDCLKVFAAGEDIPEPAVRFEGDSSCDLGGVSREFYPLAVSAFVAPQHGLFQFGDVDELTYQLVPGSAASSESQLFELHALGRVVGYALRTSCTIGVHFTRSLYRHMLRQDPTLDDMEMIDAETYQSLRWMLDNSLDDADLGLTFTAPDWDGGEMELIPGGAGVAVTDANKHQFVDAKVRRVTYSRVAAQVDAFVEGLHSVVPCEYLQLFSAPEIELVMGGVSTIDVADWQQHTQYWGDLTAESNLSVWFWECVGAFTDEQRAQLLQFTTGSSRVPVGGFAHLQKRGGEPRMFTLEPKTLESPGELPRAHTCFNRLDLPLYNSQAEMERALCVTLEYARTGFHED